jgi:type IX secretion system PorP/SprF family membrane protein
MFTHYMYNTLWLNPAYAGTRNLLTITAIHRSQWVDFDGSPRDQSLTMHAPLWMDKAGVGISVINDKLGPSKSTWIAADFAYHLRLTPKSQLSFGLKGLVNLYSNSLSTLELNQKNDVAFSQNIQSVLPNAGTGIYYYTKKFYAGISSPRLIENRFDPAASLLSKEKRHYFLIAGCVVKLSKGIQLKPTAFLKATAGAPVEADVTATFIFYEDFFLGLNYRTGDAAGFLMGFNITDQLNLGYSFDWSFANTTGRYNRGSHEVMLRYDVVYKSDKKIKSPRYF